MTLSCMYTHNYRQTPGSIWTPDIMHQWNRCLDDFKQTEIEHRQNTCLGISYQLAKVDASVIVISCVLSPALALVSTRSLRLPITSEVSHIAASFVPSRAEDCTFPVVVWQWLGDRDCTAQHNWSARDYWLSAILSFCFYYLFNFVRCPGLQCLWRDSVTLISTLLLTYYLLTRQLRSVRRTLTSDTIIIIIIIISFIKKLTKRNFYNWGIALVNALVISRLDYCNSVLAGAYDIHLRQLQGVLNAAARLIARRRKFDSISLVNNTRRPPLAANLATCRLSVLICSTASVTSHPVTWRTCASQLQATFIDAVCVPLCVATADLIVRPTKTVRYGPCSFVVAGPSTWNALPAPLRNDELPAMSFRRQLKTELYIRAYYSH